MTFDFTMDSETDADTPVTPAAFYLPDAGDCLRCGLCVNTCPTYKILPIPEETPRARVRTLDKILNQNLAISAVERQHLQHCTQCRACEAICPGRMAYGELYDTARQRLAASDALPVKLIEHKKLLHMVAIAAKLWQQTGLQALMRRSGLLKALRLDRAAALLPPVTTATLANIYSASGPHRGCVALFTGCIGRYLDSATLTSAIRVLNRIGYDVLVPNDQRCCGAIHQHQGLPEQAGHMADDNAQAFNKLAVDGIIYTSSACGLMLNEQQTRYASPLFDICEFVDSHWPDALRLQASDQTIAVHEPCSQRNGLKNQQAGYRLLARIPGAVVVPLGDNAICCGAGGVNVLTQPDIAEPLRDLKAACFLQTQATGLATANIGCALHLKTGLPSVEIAHPIRWIAAQLP